MAQCPFCAAEAPERICAACGRDTAGPRKACGKCGAFLPKADRVCFACGAPQRSDLIWKIPLIVALFAAAGVLGVFL